MTQIIDLGGGVFERRFVPSRNKEIVLPVGTNWIMATAPQYNWNKLVYGEGIWVVMDSNDNIATSTDAITWTHSTMPAGSSTQIVNLTYGNGYFVGVGGNHGGNQIIRSADGISWSIATAPPVNQVGLADVTYTNDRFIAIGSSGVTNDEVFTSTNSGYSWTQSELYPANVEATGVAYGNGVLVVCENGSNGNSTFYRSTDNGANWTQQYGGQGTWYDIIYANGIFIASGGAYNINTNFYHFNISTDDGLTWTRVPKAEILSGQYDSFYSLAASPELYVAVTPNDSNIAISTDAISWSLANIPAGMGPSRDITYGDGKFVALATSGTDRIAVSG